MSGNATTCSLGLIGAGRIGRVHARNLAAHLEGVRLRAVCDLDPEAARAAALPASARWTTDAGDILRDPEVEAVLIASATPTHAPLVQAAAAAGKHVFCEKPLALSLEEVDRVLEAVRGAGVKLQVGFNRRFDPGVQRLRAVLDEGRLGKPHLLRITSRDPAPPPADYLRVCGGLFLDMTLHDFDLAHYLLGEVEEVFAWGTRSDPEGGEPDIAVVSLRFASGALGVIDNSRRAAYGYDQRVEVLCAAGMAATAHRPEHNLVVADGEGFHSARLEEFFLERYAESFRAEVQSFLDAVRQDREPEVTGRDGRRATVLAETARRSLEEGRPVRVG